MKRILTLLCLSPVLAFADTFFKDSDWNFEMTTPHRTDIRWKEENGNRFLEFKLAGGLPGTAYNDGMRRHNAPFWERNEVAASRRLGRNEPYRLSFNFRILKGFTGERETFFQIHSWSKACQSAYPMIMMKFDRGVFQIDSLNPKGFHTIHKFETRVEDLYGQWTQVHISAEPFRADQAKYTFTGGIFPQDGYSVVANLYDCTDQWPKFGIYRPGLETGKNQESVINFDKVVVYQN